MLLESILENIFPEVGDPVTLFAKPAVGNTNEVVLFWEPLFIVLPKTGDNVTPRKRRKKVKKGQAFLHIRFNKSEKEPTYSYKLLVSFNKSRKIGWELITVKPYSGIETFCECLAESDFYKAGNIPLWIYRNLKDVGYPLIHCLRKIEVSDVGNAQRSVYTKSIVNRVGKSYFSINYSQLYHYSEACDYNLTICLSDCRPNRKSHVWTWNVIGTLEEVLEEDLAKFLYVNLFTGERV